MKSTIFLSLLALVAIGLVLFVPGVLKAVGNACHDALFKHMARSGMVLGMAEVNVTRTRLSRIAGTKAPASSFNRVREAVATMAAAYAAPAQNDTAGTDLVLVQGSRLVAAPTVSCAVGNASSTLSVGLRDPVTKVAIDATAIVNAASIATASTSQVNTGTKLLAGIDYVLPQDMEVYFTFGGAAGLANQQIRVEIPFVAA